MQPPRTRTPRIDFSNTEILRSLILNATAALATLLILRLATLFVSNPGEDSIPRYIQMITEPFVWLFRFIPPFSASVIQDAQLIDIVIAPAVAIIGLLVAGILTGWRQTGSRRQHHPALRDNRS
jgi:uncharacterized protein YggT (Ycf19 family)